MREMGEKERREGERKRGRERKREMGERRRWRGGKGERGGNRERGEREERGRKGEEYPQEMHFLKSNSYLVAGVVLNYSILSQKHQMSRC